MSGFWNNLSQTKKMSFIGLLCLLLAMTLGAGIYITHSRYQPLPDLSQATFADIIAANEKEVLDYQIDEQGRVLINERDFSKVQMLHQQSVKPAFNSQGLELYDDADYSMTEHTQKVTYQRAIQGELERTLTALEFIQYARVHLSFAERKLFSAEQQKATAAVTLFASQPLSQAQIKGVQQLVAASVDGLKSADVTVIGADGQILSVTELQGNAVGIDPVSLVSLERRLELKAIKVLEMFFAPSQFAVSMNVELDYAQRKSISQHLLPLADGKGAIKQQRQTTNLQPQVNDKGNASNQTTETEYLHGTRTEEIQDGAGKIKRITLAAVIHSGVQAHTLEQLRALLIAATGINETRGDSVSVEAIALTQESAAPPPQPMSEISPLHGQTADETISQETSAPVKWLGWWVAVPVLLTFVVLLLVVGKRRQQRQLTLLQVQQWLKDGHHAL
ncbi:flagellar M-ring protein FliF C-terminal domain-containing protein [Rheinheimera aquimaris]|jgi:flagellar M-ring protein FliF|uniref:flagellar M-ring protein FliF C-terminal domain-containing protein n=1 Tax=Rheinheimera aquimaris TaxID=412437 RepID=UPI001065E38F|nr:flagellar M-ring protein FliF C-terminal domain-containing protein [Rheinheimera aquimaris]|tara:strand:+ start:11009 stop:12352 length:1344 start_codon:yes stop_codon:yes gene_type:complete